MSKTASLTAGLVAKKGAAMPTLSKDKPAPSNVVVGTGSSSSKDSASKKAFDYYKSLTVKLDRERYERLKSVGVQLDKKSQEIFVEALDLWLDGKNRI